MADIENAAPETGAAPTSLRDTLISNFEKSQAGTLETPVLSEKPVVEADGAEKPAVDRARDPDTGRFVAKDGEQAEEGRPAKEPPAAVSDGKDAKGAAAPSPSPTSEPPAAAAPPPAPAVEAPQHWPQADRDMFAKQTAEAQKWLLDRHKSMESDYQSKAQQVGPLAKIVEGARDYFMSTSGLEPTVAIQNLLQAEFQLRYGNEQQKTQVWNDLIRSYGPPPASLLPGSAPQPTEPSPASDDGEWKDPAVSALEKRLAAMEAAAQSRQQAEEQRQRTLAQQNQARIAAELETFKTAKDASGNLLRPHFDTVMPQMQAIEQAARARGQSATLQEIYDQATWAHPTVRAQLLDEQSKEQQRKIEAEAKAKREAEDAAAKAKAEKAKQAAASLTGAPRGGGIAAPKGASVRQELEANFARFAGGRL